MKLYLSVDMEGITALPDHTFVRHTEHNYERSRLTMTKEANAIIEGAFSSGVTDILVNDSHSTMNNIIAEELHPDASLITGSSKPFSMVQALNSTYDAAIFAGYHARAGQPGVMGHTMTLDVRNVYIDDLVVGEIGMNAYVAGYYDVPVIMIAGDDGACREAKELMPHVVTVPVKETISRSAVKTLHPTKTQALLKEKVKESLNDIKNMKPLIPPKNPFLRVEFSNYGQAENAAIIPGCDIEPNTTIVKFHAENMLEAYQAMLAMIRLASGTTY